MWFLKTTWFLQIISQMWHWKIKLCVWRCSTSSEFFRKRNPHSPQRKTFSAVCWLMWFRRFFRVKNFWLQYGQGIILFWMCVRRWADNVPLWANDSLHRSQIYFRSPVCVNMWRVKPHFRRNFMGQFVHWNGLEEREYNLFVRLLGWGELRETHSDIRVKIH